MYNLEETVKARINDKTSFQGYGLQDLVRKTEKQRKLVEKQMDRSGNKGGFHPDLGSIYMGQTPADYVKIRESISKIPLSRFLSAAMPELGLRPKEAPMVREFLAKAGTTGIDGAAYLVPDKIYDVYYTASAYTDIVPLCSPIVTDIPGNSMKVDIENFTTYPGDMYTAHYIGSGGEAPAAAMSTTLATITLKQFNIAPMITNELIEDSQFDVIEMHLRRAGEEMGRFATQIFLADLITCGDGAGTQNSMTSGDTGIIDLDDLGEAWAENAYDGYLSDVYITHPGGVKDITMDDSVSKYASDYHSRMATDPPPVQGTVMGMTIVCVMGMPAVYQGTGKLYISSKWHAFVLNKQNAMLTGRKRWLKIENYSDPLRDLTGAVVSARQDQVSVIKAASCEITEK